MDIFEKVTFIVMIRGYFCLYLRVSIFLFYCLYMRLKGVLGFYLPQRRQVLFYSSSFFFNWRGKTKFVYLTGVRAYLPLKLIMYFRNWDPMKIWYSKNCQVSCPTRIQYWYTSDASRYSYLRSIEQLILLKKLPILIRVGYFFDTCIRKVSGK
jgi:hypothetical protein